MARVCTGGDPKVPEAWKCWRGGRIPESLGAHHGLMWPWLWVKRVATARWQLWIESPGAADMGGSKICRQQILRKEKPQFQLKLGFLVQGGRTEYT